MCASTGQGGKLTIFRIRNVGLWLMCDNWLGLDPFQHALTVLELIYHLKKVYILNDISVLQFRINCEIIVTCETH